MPIGGVVISCIPENKVRVLKSLETLEGVEIHGDDDAGNIVAVLDFATSDEMEKCIDRINANNSILNVGLTYLNTEDEADMMKKGEKLGKPFGFKKSLPLDS